MVRPPASSLEIGLQQPAIACQGSFGYVWRAGGGPRGGARDGEPAGGQAQTGVLAPLRDGCRGWLDQGSNGLDQTSGVI